MTLIKCGECGKEISNSAAACPNCGAKPAKPNGCLPLFLLTLGAIVVVAMSSGPSSTPKPPNTEPAATAPLPRTVYEQVKPVEHNQKDMPETGWSYDTQTDQMSGKKSYFAQSDSLNANNLHWPYGLGIHGRLILRRHARFGKSIIVNIDKGQILCNSYDGCTVLVRIDDKPAMRMSASGPSDGSTETVFLREYDRFVSALRKGKHVRIELPLYQDGFQTWEFNVTGLDWK